MTRCSLVRAFDHCPAERHVQAPTRVDRRRRRRPTDIPRFPPARAPVLADLHRPPGFDTVKRAAFGPGDVRLDGQDVALAPGGAGVRRHEHALGRRDDHPLGVRGIEVDVDRRGRQSRSSNDRPPSSLTSRRASPAGWPTTWSPRASNACRSASPSNDTGAHALPPSSERIKPRFSGSPESPAGCPDATSVRGPVKRSTRLGEIAPEASGANSPSTAWATLGIAAKPNRPSPVPISIVPFPGSTVIDPMNGDAPVVAVSPGEGLGAGARVPSLGSCPPQPSSEARGAGERGAATRGGAR